MFECLISKGTPNTTVFAEVLRKQNFSQNFLHQDFIAGWNPKGKREMRMGMVNLIQMTIISTTVDKNPLEEME